MYHMRWVYGMCKESGYYGLACLIDSYHDMPTMFNFSVLDQQKNLKSNERGR